MEASLTLNPSLRLSSLDLIAYAFLKEELINTEGSQESYPKLFRFIEVMDAIFNQKGDLQTKVLNTNKVQIKV